MENQLYIIQSHTAQLLVSYFITLLFSHLLRLKKINPRMAQSIKMAITTPITVPATAVEFDNLTVETYNACMEAQN